MNKNSLTKKIFKNRKDALIYFDLIVYGWGRVTYSPGGFKVLVDSPVSFDQRLGYPSPKQLSEAFRRVKKLCPIETKEYKLAYRRWKEARRRYLATKTVKSWNFYVNSRDNSNNVAYNSKIAMARRGGVEFYKSRRHRYLIHELLPRIQEGKRAKRQMRESVKEMKELRSKIFDILEVPKKYRTKVLLDKPN